jgi:hypothetical protein
MSTLLIPEMDTIVMTQSGETERPSLGCRPGRRRRWMADEKRRIVAESEAPGSSVLKASWYDRMSIGRRDGYNASMAPERLAQLSDHRTIWADAH